MSAPLTCEKNETIEENPFVYNANKELPSLQEMASCQVALAIWNGYISRCSLNKRRINCGSILSFDEMFRLYSTYQEDTETLMEKLNTPRCIEKLLKISLKKVRYEMEECIHCFCHRTMFYGYPDGCRISSFKPDWCVWLPNGTIDYLKTAEAMVSPKNDELNLKTKFAIMCEFYMEEELKKFPLDSLPTDFIEELVRNYDVRCTCYWIHYLKGDRCEEIDAYKMVAQCKLRDFGGIRINHFWHRLSEDEQVKALYNILVRQYYGFFWKEWKVVERLFGTMSLDQQQHVLSMPQASKRIISYSGIYQSSPKYAVWAWKRCRDITTGEEFCEMMHILLHCEFNTAEDIFPTTVELWDLAYDHHRNIVVNQDWYFEFILSVRCNYRDYYTPATYILLNKSLALKSTNERKALLIEYSKDLATNTLDQRYIQEMLDLNLPHIDDRMEFKKFLANCKEMKRHCAWLWAEGNFDVLNATLEFYFNGDMNSIRKFNQEVLSDVEYSGTSVITDADKWHKTCQFIDEILSNDVANASVVKQQLVSRFLTYYIPCKRVCKHLTLALKNVESLLSNETDLNHVKTEFIKSHPALNDELFWTREDICDDEYFHSMIEWCCDGNEEAVVQLKNKIRTHDIMFDIVFFQLNKVYVIEGAGLKMSLLTRLNKYLSWYLASDDKIMAYKMLRLNESDKLSIFSAISQQRDEASLKMLLGWFFEGDEEKIR